MRQHGEIEALAQIACVNQDYRVYNAAYEALIALGADRVKLCGELLLHSPDKYPRYGAANRLQCMVDPRMLPILEAALGQEEEPLVRGPIRSAQTRTLREQAKQGESQKKG